MTAFATIAHSVRAQQERTRLWAMRLPPVPTSHIRGGHFFLNWARWNLPTAWVDELLCARSPLTGMRRLCRRVGFREIHQGEVIDVTCREFIDWWEAERRAVQEGVAA